MIGQWEVIKGHRAKKIKSNQFNGLGEIWRFGGLDKILGDWGFGAVFCSDYIERRLDAKKPRMARPDPDWVAGPGSVAVQSHQQFDKWAFSRIVILYIVSSQEETRHARTRQKISVRSVGWRQRKRYEVLYGI